MGSRFRPRRRADGDDATAERYLNVARTSPPARKAAATQLAAIAQRRGDDPLVKTLEIESNEANVVGWPDPFVRQLLPLKVGAVGRVRRIESLERQGRYADAQGEYLKLLALERTSKTLARAATNSARLNDFAQAVQFAQQAVELDALDSDAQYTLALVLYNGLEKSLAQNPGYAETKDVCGQIVAASKRTVELKPDFARAYQLWGLALKQLDDPAAAREPIRKGLGYRPDDIELLIAMGQVLAATGDRTGAITMFEDAKKAKPTDVRAERELRKLRTQ